MCASSCVVMLSAGDLDRLNVSTVVACFVGMTVWNPAMWKRGECFVLC